MHVILKLITTQQTKRFNTLKECCHHLSIREENLQQYYKHQPFTDGIFQKFAYGWYVIEVHDTLERCLENPIRMTFIDRWGDRYS